MEEASLRVLRPREQGAALILALLALTILLPLVLVLTNLTLLRQRQVQVFRNEAAGAVAVGGGLQLAMSQLRSGQIDPREDQDVTFETTNLGPRPIDVRVLRQADVVLMQDGQVVAVPTGMADQADAGSGEGGSHDPLSREATTAPADPGKSESFRVHVRDALMVGASAEDVVPLYRRLAVYVVEVKTRPIPRIPEVRLLAVVVRTPDGRVTCIGRRYDRGYF
jgi:hypothetical protein